ncbi:hypothetical protein VR41_12575 [Streptomyces sp. NRRL B-1568]|nr:hypothetical protein VR41_12575 [Streptomyces sp. NRRL B-1568]
MFITAAFICFNVARGDEAKLAGWALYACGWLPALGMLIWCAVKRRKPGVGGAVSFLMLLLFGGIFWLSLAFKVRCRTRLELDQRFRSSADVRAAFV